MNLSDHEVTKEVNAMFIIHYIPSFTIGCSSAIGPLRIALDDLALKKVFVSIKL